jgi:predicted enzyme related to lactoylglutathione lyase
MSQNGHFIWYDLMSKDPKASEEFYAKVVGWNYQDYPMQDFTYRMIAHGENQLGGIMPLKEEEETPSHWISYLTVPDVDATVKKAEELGGKSCVPPTDIPEMGRFAVVNDPQGGFFSPFTPSHEMKIPEGLGTVAWRELITTEPDKARDFYSKLIGWQPENMEIGSDKYTMFKVGDESVAGMVDKAIPEGEDVRPYWIPYFLVESVDEACKTAQENGGQLQVEPTDIPDIGRFAILTDPQGATFAVYSPPGEN